jgi:hypothetical protein
MGLLVEAVRGAFGIISRPASTPLGNIYRQRALIKEHEYMRLGRLVLLIFDPDAMIRPDPGPDRKIWPNYNSIDWQGNPDKPGPWLSLSKRQEDLLLTGNDGGFLGAVPHPPDIRDNSGTVAIDREQRYRDRTVEHLRGTNFLVIEPVAEIIYKPVGIPSWCKIRVMPDHMGKGMTFLIDPETREGHLIGGVFIIGAAA